MTPEQIKELERLQAEAKETVRKIGEIAERIHEDFPPDKIKEFISKLKEAAAVFHGRKK